MVKPDPVLYWLEELFGDINATGRFVALQANAFDIYGLPGNLTPRCGDLLEYATNTSAAGSVTRYLVKLDDSAEAEFEVTTPPPDSRRESHVCGVIRFATQAWRPKYVG